MLKKVVMFNGENMDGWVQRDGSKTQWSVSSGVMTVGKGDIVSKEEFSDAFIHLEFKIPDMPNAHGQAKGNSGVFVHGRYEIQVLDSYGINIPGKGDCAAIYDKYAPLVNACLPAETWQTYDIIFRAPRFNVEENVTEKARLTLIYNGIPVHNNIELTELTSCSLDERFVSVGPLLLQDHGDCVCYRNVWLMHLPHKGSDEYLPPTRL